MTILEAPLDWPGAEISHYTLSPSSRCMMILELFEGPSFLEFPANVYEDTTTEVQVSCVV